MDQNTLNKGLNTLSQLDSDLKKALAIHGKPDPRDRPGRRTRRPRAPEGPGPRANSGSASGRRSGVP
ncbi:MAG: hypothetical protein VYA08_08720, partial [Pseudomonadota bacterium]|nr:hypothetical protein [Pseudomonadota bacterium]